MRKVLTAFLCLAGLLTQFSSAFDYIIVGTEGLLLVDEASGILNIKTLFIGDPVQVHVIGLEWAQVNATAATSTDSILYKTYVDGILQAEGSFDLTDVDRELPTQVDAGVITVTTNGAHTIQVVLSVNGEPIETEQTYQAFRAGVSLIPLILVFFLALSTHNVEISLFTTIFVGACIIAGNIKQGFQDMLSIYILQAMADEGHVYVILFTLFISGVVALIEKSGGMHGFTAQVGRFAKTPRTGQLAAFVCALCIFFDDYSNLLITGLGMSPLLDTVFCARELLAFICDSVAAPVASLTPVSAWIGFEVGLIQTELDRIMVMEGTETLSIGTSAMGVFLKTIGYRYYPIFMLFLMASLLILQRHSGPMLIAQRKTQVYRRTDGGDGRNHAAVDVNVNAPSEDTPKLWWNMVVPILVLVFLILWLLFGTGHDGTGTQAIIDMLQESDSFSALLWGTMGSSILTYLFYMVQFKKDGKFILPTPSVLWAHMQSMFRKKEYYENHEKPATPIMGLYEAVHSYIYGLARIFPALIVLVLAWSTGSIMTAVGTDRLFSEWIVGGTFPPQFLPTIGFFMSVIMALATGTSWGTMAVVFPLLLVPTWIASGGDETIFYSTIAGVLSGAVAGDSMSPISDTTVISSLSTECYLINHVITQMPYAMFTVFSCILVGTLPVGYSVWPNGVSILFGLVVAITFVLTVCVPVVSKTGNFDFLTELHIWRKGPDCELHKLREDTKAAWEFEFNQGPPVVKAAEDDEFPADRESFLDADPVKALPNTDDVVAEPPVQETEKLMVENV